MTPEYRRAANEHHVAANLRRQLEAALILARSNEESLKQKVADLYLKENPPNSVTDPN